MIYPAFILAFLEDHSPNMKSTKLTFQESKQTNRFRERVAREKKTQEKATFKKNINPRLTFKKSAYKEIEQVIHTQTSLSNATGTGSVNVTIKKTERKPQNYEKKTGALSPRAPEKIKKNRTQEMKVYGEKACFAFFKMHPENIIRAWSSVAMSHKIGDIFSYLATNKKAYHVVSQEELNLVSGSEHNGGICFLVKKPRTYTLSGYLDIPHKKDALILINRISNVYNLGSIIRTATIFGVTGVVSDNIATLYNSATLRVAEGGMEYIRSLNVENNITALELLRKEGYQIVHLSSRGLKTPLKQIQFNSKVVFVLGEDTDDELIQTQDLHLNITPTNPLQTELNISVATGILLSHWAMQY